MEVKPGMNGLLLRDNARVVSGNADEYQTFSKAAPPLFSHIRLLELGRRVRFGSPEPRSYPYEMPVSYEVLGQVAAKLSTQLQLPEQSNFDVQTAQHIVSVVSGHFAELSGGHELADRGTS